MKSLLEYIIEYDNTDQYDVEHIDEGLGDTIKKTWYKFKNLFKTSLWDRIKNLWNDSDDENTYYYYDDDDDNPFSDYIGCTLEKRDNADEITKIYFSTFLPKVSLSDYRSDAFKQGMYIKAYINTNKPSKENKDKKTIYTLPRIAEIMGEIFNNYVVKKYKIDYKSSQESKKEYDVYCMHGYECANRLKLRSNGKNITNAYTIKSTK